MEENLLGGGGKMALDGPYGRMSGVRASQFTFTLHDPDHERLPRGGAWACTEFTNTLGSSAVILQHGADADQRSVRLHERNYCLQYKVIYTRRSWNK